MRHAHVRGNVSQQLIYTRLAWLAQTPTVISGIIKCSDWWAKEGSVWLSSKIWSVAFLAERVPSFRLILPSLTPAALSVQLRLTALTPGEHLKNKGSRCSPAWQPLCFTLSVWSLCSHHPLTSVSTELRARPYLRVSAVFGREGIAVHLVSTSPFHSKQRVSQNRGKDTAAVTIHQVLAVWGNPLNTYTQGCDLLFCTDH